MDSTIRFAETSHVFREALMLHDLDDLDSKMAAVRAALDSDKAKEIGRRSAARCKRGCLRVDLFSPRAGIRGAERVIAAPALIVLV